MYKIVNKLDIPADYKKYVSNYIDECLTNVDEQGYVEEFICDDKSILHKLTRANIITLGYRNRDDILIPLDYYHFGNPGTYKGPEIYMISDYILKECGIKVPSL